MKLIHKNIAKEKCSLIYCLNHAVIASIPYLLIILIFIIYLFFGAIILNELEISEEESNQLNKTYLSFNAYKLKLNEIFLNSNWR
jgi:hypothetical protein